jgi:hypothetical protein
MVGNMSLMKATTQEKRILVTLDDAENVLSTCFLEPIALLWFWALFDRFILKSPQLQINATKIGYA